MQHPQVDILMATYNGGLHLDEQLRSLQRQSYPHWQLLVRDDGSADGTVTLLQRWQQREPRIRIIEDQAGTLGAARNYLHLMTYSQSPFCMLCDQDDIWMEHKTESLLHALRQQQGPAAAYANGWFYKDGQPVYRQISPLHPRSLRQALFLNAGIQGCSLMMNRELLQLLPPYPDTIAMHDHLLTMAAICFGRFIYVDQELMYYRQHAGNVTGNQQQGVRGLLQKFSGSRLAVIDRQHFLANKAFFERYRQQLSPDHVALFGAYFEFAEHAGLLRRLGIILKHGFSLGQHHRRLLLKTLLRKPIQKPMQH